MLFCQMFRYSCLFQSTLSFVHDGKCANDWKLPRAICLTKKTYSSIPLAGRSWHTAGGKDVWQSFWCYIHTLSYVYLLYYVGNVCVCVCVLLFFFFNIYTLGVGLLARSQYPEGPATGHLDTGFSCYPVPKSKCWDASQDSKLPLHASHVALPT